MRQPACAAQKYLCESIKNSVVTGTIQSVNHVALASAPLQLRMLSTWVVVEGEILKLERCAWLASHRCSSGACT